MQLLKKGYHVTLKPHPRADSKKEIALFNQIQQGAKSINKPIKIIKRNIIAEKLLNDIDLVITCNSVGANKALGNGLPVIYIDTQFNKNQVLHKLKQSHDIILMENWRQVINKVDYLFSSNNNFIKWKKKG